MRAIDADRLMEQVKYIHQAVDTSDVNIAHHTGFHSATSQIQGLIACMPAIEVPRWIPVTERLPKREDADRRGRVFVVEKNGEVSIANWRYVNWYPQKFTHWMPLPTPPKDGDT